ncbi:hypothetical protein Tco_0982320 [Tanacetum coccineum]
MVHRPLLCPTEIQSLRLVFGKDYRKLGELVLSLVQHFILKPMSVKGPVQTLEDMLRAFLWNGQCMRTRNSNFPNNSTITIPRRRNRGRALNVVEPELRTIVEVAPLAERTMEELLRAPT